MDTIEHMRTFTTVVSAGSFTAAAKRLDTSTKQTSKYVRQLEERLGVQLLNRTTRSLALTEVGQAYFERCMQLVEEFDELEAAIKDRQSSPRGRLLVSAPVTFGEKYLTQAIAGFLDQQPDITVDLRLTDRFVNIVDEGFDVTVRIAKLEDSSLIARKLAPAKIVLCASPAYLEYKYPQHPLELAAHNCIVDSNFKKGAQWPFIVDGEPMSIFVKGRFRVNGATAASKMAMEGQGLALCPSYVVGDDLAAGRLVPLLQAYNAFDLGLYALYPHNRHLATKVRIFVDYLAKYFSGTPKWDRFQGERPRKHQGISGKSAISDVS